MQHFNTGVTYVYEDKIQDQFLQFEPLTNIMGLGLLETLHKDLRSPVYSGAQGYDSVL